MPSARLNGSAGASLRFGVEGGGMWSPSSIVCRVILVALSDGDLYRVLILGWIRIS